MVLRQVEVTGNGATTLALLDLLHADTVNGGEADTQIRSDEETHTLQANVYSAKTPRGVRTRKLLMEVSHKRKGAHMLHGGWRARTRILALLTLVQVVVTCCRRVFVLSLRAFCPTGHKCTP